MKCIANELLAESQQLQAPPPHALADALDASGEAVGINIEFLMGTD